MKQLLFLLLLASCSRPVKKINVGILNSPLSLKSWNLRDGASILIGNQIHKGLLTLDSSNSSIIPYAAQSWSYSKNYKKMFFILRKDILFHDGTKLVCKHVKDSFKKLQNRQQETSLPFDNNFKFYCQDQVFVIEHLVKPLNILQLIASPAASISKDDGVIGIGPFKLK